MMLAIAVAWTVVVTLAFVELSLPSRTSKPEYKAIPFEIGDKLGDIVIVFFVVVSCGTLIAYLIEALS